MTVCCDGLFVFERRAAIRSPSPGSIAPPSYTFWRSRPRLVNLGGTGSEHSSIKCFTPNHSRYGVYQTRTRRVCRNSWVANQLFSIDRLTFSWRRVSYGRPSVSLPMSLRNFGCRAGGVTLPHDEIQALRFSKPNITLNNINNSIITLKIFHNSELLYLFEFYN